MPELHAVDLPRMTRHFGDAKKTDSNNVSQKRTTMIDHETMFGDKEML